MKHYRILTLLVIIALLPFWSIWGKASTTALAATVPGPTGQNSADWVSTFHDEFDGTALNRSVWRSDYPNGTNGELQEYVNDDSHRNYLVANGILSLTARRESYSGKSYTSGVITTQNGFTQKYGFFEMRAKMPTHAMGLWPAFWLMPNPTGSIPELDILEWLGRQPAVAYMVLHYLSGQSQTYYNGPDYSAAWHTYGVNWQPGTITWYIDGVERKRFTDTTKIPNMAMFLIANLAVGGTWPHSPDSTTVFPATYAIDYIRVWRYSPAAPTPTTAPSTNMLRNGSFETTGATPWYTPWTTQNSLGASFTQDTSTYADGYRSFKAVLPTANSTQPWVVALMQKNLALTSGRAYTISFYAKASYSRSIKAIVQNQNSPYTEYFNRTYSLTTSWTRFTYTFTASTSISAMLNFNLASSTGSIWIDKVSLCPGTTACN
ncbi:MAG: family 16 glycosylhydrolase [Omnitrophica WOR_2 bacterium]